jgi:hypothetical protein
MSQDGPMHGEGENAQSKFVLDMAHNPPKVERIHLVDAVERVKRDPKRYRFFHRDEVSSNTHAEVPR